MTRSRVVAAAVIAGLACAGIAASAAVSSTASRAAVPVSLDITMLSAPTGAFAGKLDTHGPQTCTGTGADEVCVQALGSQSPYTVTIPVRDNATGRSGSMVIDSVYLYSGTATRYAGKDGRRDATGSMDGTVAFSFEGGDTITGSFHDQRVNVANHETDSFALTLTGGTGRYEGFQATFTSSREEEQSPPGPIGDDGQAVKDGTRKTQARQGALAVARALEGRTVIKRAAHPVADFATVGLLVPANRSLAVKAVAAPGSTCSGGFSGSRSVALRPVVADAKGVAAFPAVASGTFAAKTAVKAAVTCRGPGARPPVRVERRLRAFSVLGK